MTEGQLRNIIYTKLNISVKDDNIERLTKEQLEFITHDINVPCYLEACPGSGKTEVVGIKAAYELIDWKEKFSGIAIVSFTNNASSEIEKRAKKYAGTNATAHPHFIGTLDSFFYKYVLCPFFYSYVGFKGKNGDCSPRTIIDERSEADFLNNKKYQPKTYYAIPNKSTLPGANAFVGIPISANRFYYDVIIDDFIVLPPIKNVRVSSTLSEILNKPEQQAYLRDKLDSWLTNKIIIDGFWASKKAFWGDGFLTFRDCEYIILQILHNKQNIRKNIIKRFPYVLIDECQDLSPMQLIILNYLVEDGLNVFFIGDLNQSIYKFREVDPQRITEFIGENKLVNLHLSINFRSNQKIVDVFCNIFSNSINGNEKQLLKNCLILIEYDENEVPQLIKRYQEIIVEANEEAKEEIIRVPQSSIIIRGSTLLNKFRPFKTDSNSPLTILAIALQLWNSKQKNTEIIGSAISLFGYFLSKTFYKNEGNIRNQYCQESISNVKWRTSLSTLLTELSNELYPFKDEKSNNLTFSQWAIIVRKYLPVLISKLPIESYIDISVVKIKAESGLGTALVSDNVSQYKSGSKIRTTTIHDVKGETLDSVMIVSSLDKKSKGGHWEDWFNQIPSNANEYEYKRYGYVAFSRPKHLLVLATPKLSSDDRKFFEEFGFRIENI
ncbi:MAG TPA: ATP-dependent helicase [Ignavibacteria bacterium]